MEDNKKKGLGMVLEVIISPARLDEPFVIIPDSARINDIWD